jgi:histidinol-phosphate aminotransferase
MERRVATLVEERGRLFAALSELDGVSVFPSGANFLLFRVHGDGRAVWKALVARGVLVRDFSRWPRLDECLRVTVGTAEENDAFLAALRGALRSWSGSQASPSSTHQPPGRAGPEATRPFTREPEEVL